MTGALTETNICEQVKVEIVEGHAPLLQALEEEHAAFEAVCWLVNNPPHSYFKTSRLRVQGASVYIFSVS